MTTITPDNIARSSKYSLPLFLALIAAGLAGNYFKFQLFLDIDFLFGSIFAMLALQFFGVGRGILAAAIIASYTFILWNHPYAIIIMTAEMAVVGWLSSRRKIGLIQADALYWLLIGMPLVYLFYHVAMDVPASNTHIILVKQALNGIANALAARLIFTGYAIRSRKTLISYRDILYSLLVFFILCPALIILAANSRTDFIETDGQIRTTLMQDSRRVTDRLETWTLNRQSAILNLAEMAATRSPQQMQSYLEQAKKADLNFLRVGLMDSEATTTAYYPLLDEIGQKTIGLSYADRPFITQLKQTLKPMLSEVNMSRVGLPKPRVVLLAPVVIGGKYGGFIAGVLNMEQIQDHLHKSTQENGGLYTLLDTNGNVIMTNRTEQTVMKPFVRDKGSLKQLDTRISQWVPTLSPTTPKTERWKKSFYVAESSIGNLAEWRLILEQPVAPFQKRLYDEYTSSLVLLFLGLLMTLGLAEFLSRKIVLTLEELRILSHELPIKLATDDASIIWPQSGLIEINHLIGNFKEMAHSLSEQFIEIRQINETLEQRVAERTAELQESETRYRNFFENNLSVMHVIDPESGSIVDANPAACAFYGWSREELTNKKIHEIDILSREEIAIEIERSKNRLRNHFFFKHKLADGTVRDVEVYSGPIQTNGKTLLLSIVHDISDRKQAEKAVREAKMLLEKTLASLNEAIFLVETGTRKVLDCNITCETMFGYLREEMIGITTAFLHISEEMSERFGREMQQAYAENGFFETTFIMKRKDGSVFDSEHSVTPIRDDLGVIVRHVCVVRDISERKRAEEERLSLEKKLLHAQKLDSLGILAGGVAHDFNNILTAIIGNAELALMRLNPEAPVRENLQRIEKSAARAADLARQMLAYSGKGRFIVKPIDLNRQVEEILHLLEVSISRKAVLQLNLTRPLPVVEADASQLRQILINLVLNASEAIGEASGVITISSGSRECNRNYLKDDWLDDNLAGGLYAFLEVADTGCGMDRETMAKIFDPFFSTKFTGRGLGMAAVLGIVRGHKGAIKVNSEPGKGASFTILLPVYSRQTEICIDDSRHDSWKGEGTVLLVDDEENIRRVGSEMLQELGFQVVAAEDGKHALEIYTSRDDIACVILDLTMPRMDGEQCFRELKQLNADVKVIMSSGYTEQEVTQQFAGAGLSGFVQKPYNLSTLKEVLRGV